MILHIIASLALSIVASIPVALVAPGAQAPGDAPPSGLQSCKAKNADPTNCIAKPPKLERHPDPKYPDEAKKSGVEGTVVLWVVVGVDGRARDILVHRSLQPALDQAAISAVWGWTFKPARNQRGGPVATLVTVDVSFKR